MHAAPTPPRTPALPVTFRPQRTRIVALCVGIVMFVVITVVSLLLDSAAPWEQSSFVVLAAIFLGVLALLSRPKVVAEADGVTVVNLTQVRRLAWAEILRVNLRQGDPWVFLDLSDGTSLPVMGIQPGIARQHAIRDARALRALVDAHGTGTESGGPSGAADGDAR
ncbi:PH domain-containing protein [Streptomyces sp. 8L]|uniref:PH domain-containing protein n=1 Tax=Streptomyces sp. 8L TaxID=2877242 RepID=UPI001CD3ADFA|nr:PH domain-containing protein [Streptomyces sp. 8L]MCA1221876.1 PH domain-containing protein [Streptomyces sp. 8L]